MFNLQSFKGDLIDYLRIEKGKKFNFEPTEGLSTLQDILNQLIKSLDWLHENGNVFNGELHPRNVFFSQASSKKTKIILHLPEKQNPFREVDKFSKNFFKVRLNCPIKQDMIAVVGMAYFLFTCGRNLFIDYAKIEDPSNELDVEKLYKDSTIEKTLTSIWIIDGLLQMKCICTPPGSCANNAFTLTCKYRGWVYRMAHNWMTCVLEEILPSNSKTSKKYYTENLSSLKNHPLFWTIQNSIGFLQRSSNFLSDSRSYQIYDFQSIHLGEKNFPLYPAVNLTSDIFHHFPNLLKFLHKKDSPVDLNEWIIDSYSLLKEIRNKVSEDNPPPTI